MAKTQEKESIYRAVQKQIRTRIFFALFIFISFTIGVTSYAFIKNYERFMENINSEGQLLANYIIAQKLIGNDEAIELKIKEKNKKNKRFEYQPFSQLTSDKTIWNFPFVFVYYYPIMDINNKSFGALKITFNFIAYNGFLTLLLIKALGFLALSLLFFIVMYPLSNKIPKKLFVDPIMDFLSFLKKENKNVGYKYNYTITKEIQEIQERLEDIVLEKEKSSRAAAIGKLAAQVAHDIRSPLAALNTCIKHLPQLPDEQRILMRDATDRINYIADNLLARYKTGDVDKSVVTNQLVTHFLGPSIESIISEIRLSLAKHITLSFVLNTDGFSAFSQINSHEFKRILSNIINNAIESFQQVNADSVVTVSLTSCSDWNRIIICDNGCGIPEDKLQAVFSEGVSFKDKGSGLGLFHAKTTIEQWHGEIHLSSRLHKGTTVTINLPKQSVPKWFLTRLNLSLDNTILILDDDTSVHGAWKQRIFQLSPDFNVQCFTNINGLQKWLKENNSNWLLLSDYALSDNQMTGLAFIRENKIADQSILVTSHYEEDTVLTMCVELGLKLLPKNLFPYLPLSLNEKVDIVLIDDNDNLRDTWALVANIKGIKLLTYPDMNAFNLDVNCISKQTKIYLDYELADGVNGLVCAKNLFQRGFNSIYLTTGYDFPNTSTPPYLKGIVGKSFPTTDRG